MKKLIYDVGASAIKYALMDNEANIIEQGQVNTPKDTLEHFLSELEKIYHIYKDDIDGIGLSLPGTIDTLKGQIYAPGGLVYNENVNIVERMSSFTDLPIAIENDGKSAALAELWKGNLKDCEDGIVIVVGSGLGGGIIKNGQLLKGQHLFAGEFSYVYQGEGDNFMERSWAMKGSTTALLMNYSKRKGIDISLVNGIEVFKKINEGDLDAVDSLRDISRELAKGIYNLQCILDPSKILIGGGISQQPILLETIQEELDKIYECIPFDIPHVHLDNCRYYNDSNLIGALYNFHKLYQ